MALTPEDVVNKRFNPTKFREGYDQDEVDDFLDEVVVELRRLNQENEELRQRLVQGEQRIQELQRQAQSGPASAASAPAAAPAPAVVPAPEPAFAPVPAPAPAAPAVSADAMDPGNTNNLLQLARRLHEEHVREGMEKRDALIAEGHATAARVVSEAQEGARAALGDIEQQKAALEQQRDALQQEKAGLEQQVDQLRTFEREYRQKLRSYIEGQLRDLDRTPELPAGAPESSPVPGGQQTSQPVQVGAPPAAEQAGPSAQQAGSDGQSGDSGQQSGTSQQSAPAFPGAQPSGGFGAYGQPSEFQGFAGN
ncbi:DivIVA domain-containing protein [Pseudolysinimonas sp.]|uniref:DivIVA domain-containing protein n=1 Tax=Pseudolysinimonas sp. TaxID=2680009 RepID=UPI003F81B802